MIKGRSKCICLGISIMVDTIRRFLMGAPGLSIFSVHIIRCTQSSVPPQEDFSAQIIFRGTYACTYRGMQRAAERYSKVIVSANIFHQFHEGRCTVLQRMLYLLRQGYNEVLASA